MTIGAAQPRWWTWMGTWGHLLSGAWRPSAAFDRFVADRGRHEVSLIIIALVLLLPW